MSKKLGAIAQELWRNEEDPVRVGDLTDRLLSTYEKNVIECTNRGNKEFPVDFFVVILTKKERLFDNVLRNYFIARQTCPPPNYDQIVYRFRKEGEFLELLWVVPSREASRWYKQNALVVNKEERELLDFVLEFDNGDLDKQSAKLNKEIAFKLRRL